MICDKYRELSPNEKNILIGEIQHAIQTDSNCLEFVQIMLQWAKKEGVFNGVSFTGEIPLFDTPVIVNLHEAHSGLLLNNIEQL